MRSILKYSSYHVRILKYSGCIFSSLFLFIFFNSGLAQSHAAYTWQEVHSVDFGSGANHFTIKAASEGLGGEVELRLDQTDGPVIGRACFHHTGGPEYFLPYDCDLIHTVVGTHEVYMNFQDYTEPASGGVLNISHFEFSLIEEPVVVSQNRLHIYPPVPGLEPSPYYDIYIQKADALNATNLAEVTNWERPFAWFTQCTDWSEDGNNMGYYSNYIGGWSNTYINFELDPNTPIVVKISRRNDTGDDAPSGPIDAAVVRPARRVDAWEIIDGDVYVTMRQPALVAVDIDGQMETRVSPRATPTGWNAQAFPYRSRKEGAHSVTIFANPFIEDKPQPDDPGVLVVKAGEKIPDTQELLNEDWDILYFEPGVHKASVDVDSLGYLSERKWQAVDPITLQDDKSYYIPGDAIVYGNFTDINRSNNQSVNVRIYGHGTISGSKINHNKVEGEAYSNDGWWTRALYLRDARNCHFEGITAVDPAFHTLCIVASVNSSYEPNTIKWSKVIAWRTNSDGTAVSGNTEMEDCFIRCQDDGHYIGGTTRMRRVVFWHDVNGQTFRGDFTNRRYSENNAPNIPEDIIYEDIDIIYARGVFSTSDNGFGLIGVKGGTENRILTGGVENTGQMVLFRNINIPDPLPTRNLFSFKGEDKIGDYAGIRFENIDYQGSQVFGWRNILEGTPDCNIRNFVFDNITINDEKLDQRYVDDHFITDHFYDPTYRNDYSITSSDYMLITTSSNGMITLEETGPPGEVKVVATPDDGYRLSSWSGDLSGSEQVDTLLSDRDKAITANFELITYTISTSAENGTIKLDPQAEEYLPGTQVTITAVGDLGYGIESWGGDLSGTENPVTITMDGDKNISVTFKVIETYKLNIDTKYGSVLPDPPGGAYNPGTIVTLTPVDEPGYIFEKWLGDLTGTDNPATIVMDTSKTITARFIYDGFGEVSSAINFGGPDVEAVDGTIFTGNTSGSNYSTTESIDGTEDDLLYQSERYGTFSIDIPVENGSYEILLMFAEIYHSSAGNRTFNVSIEGEQVINNLDIYAEVGKNTAYNETHRTEISDGELNIGFQSIINNAKISAIKIFNNTFRGETYTLTKGSAANGLIEAFPSDGPYPAGSNVLLNAMPNPGYMFEGWEGDLTGSENPTVVYMDGDKNISAIFVGTNWYNLEISTINGSVTVDPEKGIYGYTEGTDVTLAALPDPGYAFDGWSGDVSGTENPVSLTMNSDKSITANFVEEVFYSLSVESENGSISLEPPGSIYAAGTEVTLTAIPDKDHIFVEWGGDLSGSDNPLTIIMDTVKHVTAIFKNPFALSLTVNSTNGSVLITPEQDTYYPGSSVILTAIPDEGYEFAGWHGDITGLDNPLGFVMNNDITITASFNKLTNILDKNTGVHIDLQVYPNPLSGETTIKYYLETASLIDLSVYNLYGQHLTILVNEYQANGYHIVKWNPHETTGTGFKEGIYFIVLKTGNTPAVIKKITILK